MEKADGSEGCLQLHCVLRFIIFCVLYFYDEITDTYTGPETVRNRKCILSFDKCRVVFRPNGGDMAQFHLLLLTSLP